MVNDNTEITCDDCELRSQRTGFCPHVIGDRTGGMACEKFEPIKSKRDSVDWVIFLKKGACCVTEEDKEKDS